MSEEQSDKEPRWQSISKQKKEEQFGRIPREWRLKSLPPSNVTSYIDIPRTCGLLTQQELSITEEYDAVALAEAIRDKGLKCVDVTRAFCKVCREAQDAARVILTNTTREQLSPTNLQTALLKSSLTMHSNEPLSLTPI
jgi:hypothetical protein